GAEKIAAQMLQNVRNLNIEHLDSAVAKIVTISIGISTVIPDDKGSVEALIKVADQALYEAKAAGRNQFRTIESADQ
ncbi:MAG TPA: diguanylate cyclase, partial [Spongiibacteraceae bacterium]|nr:diguanylate cyclase [Spongiibacteraceae bacterium]